MSDAEPQRPRHGELVSCPDCGSKDWEIRAGGVDNSPPPTVTCSACLGLWWLEASANTPGLRIRPVPMAGIQPLPDAPPRWLASS